MRRFLVVVFACLLMALTASAQGIMTISGRVTDRSNGHELNAVSVIADDGHTATVSNANGQFEIKVPVGTRTLTFSRLAYHTLKVAVTETGKPMNVRMSPSTVMLDEVLIADPEDVLRLAIQNLPLNNTVVPMNQQCFYRETTQKGKRFIYVAEAITDMYKTAYTEGITRDKVAIMKARRLISTLATDTLGAKIVGGPVIPVNLDIMKNLNYVLSDDLLGQYEYAMRPAPGHGQVVVTISPSSATSDMARLYGDFYIDVSSFAVTHIELKLDMRNEFNATMFMLKSKPAGVRFKPRGMELYINYKKDLNGRLSLSYIRTELSFKCEWKRKLFAAPYVVTSEMVVTDQHTENAQPVKGMSYFREREVLYDHPEYFGDPKFWEQYNIIAPTHTLEKGIKAFLKKNNSAK